MQIHNNTPLSIGNNIRKWRMLKGYKQFDFAKMIGISKATLSKIENGKYGKINLLQMQKIAECLKIKITQLFIDPSELLS